MWNWVTLLDYTLNDCLLSGGHGWNCPEPPPHGLKHWGTSTSFVCLE